MGVRLGLLGWVWPASAQVLVFELLQEVMMVGAGPISRPSSVPLPQRPHPPGPPQVLSASPFCTPCSEPSSTACWGEHAGDVWGPPCSTEAW